MKKFVFLCWATLLAGCSSEPFINEKGLETEEVACSTRFLNTETVKEAQEFLVKFRDKYAPTIASNTQKTRSESGVARSGLSRFDNFLDFSDAIKFERVFPVGKFEKRMRASGLDLWYKISYDKSVSSDYLKQKLSKMPEVAIVEMLVPVELPDKNLIQNIKYVDEQSFSGSRNGFVNDPMLVQQWHYDNDGSQNEHAKAGADINLFKAWERTMGSPNVIVAVVDEFAQYNHPDLKDNMWVNEAESNGQPGVDDDGNGYVDDFHGFNFVANKPDCDFGQHGTHVSGTIAAVNNNGIGVSGIAGGSGNNDGVKIMACGILSNHYSGNEYTVANAVVYATDNGASILQNSWGYATLNDMEEFLNEGKETCLALDALEYFIEYAGYDEDGNLVGPMAGGVVIFAAGNSGMEIGNRMVFPAAYSKFICVGSVGCDYRPACYTCNGPWVDISAPGGDQVFDKEKGGVLSTVFGDNENDFEYSFLQGTSMACPHVSGVAALALSYADSKNFILTNQQLNDIILSSGRNIDDLFVGHKNFRGSSKRPPCDLNMADFKGNMGNGLLDANLALDRVDQLMGMPSNHTAPAPVSKAEAKANTNAGEVTVNWSVGTDCQNELMQSYAIYFSTLPITVGNDEVVQDGYMQGPVIIPVEKGCKAGDVMEKTLRNLENGKEYTIAIVGYDQWREPSKPVLLKVATKQVENKEALSNLHTATLTSHSALISWNEALDAEGRPYGSYEANLYMKDYPDQKKSQVLKAKGEEGNELTCLFNDIPFGNTFVIEVQGFDISCTPSEVSKLEFYLPYKIDWSELSDVEVVQYWESKDWQLKVLDTDYSEVDMQLDGSPEGWSLEMDEKNWVLKFTGPVSDKGTGDYTLNFLATDSKWGKFTFEQEVTVLPNVKPMLMKELPDQYMEGDMRQVQVALNDYFSDENMESLTYKVEVDGSSVTAEVNGNGQLVLARQTSGLSVVKVRATDHGGLMAEGNFKVMGRKETAKMELYPNPVRDVLNVRFGKEVSGEIAVKVTDHNGHVVRDVIRTVSPYSPAQIDMRGVKRGQLQVNVTYKGETFKGNVIKM